MQAQIRTYPCGIEHLSSSRLGLHYCQLSGIIDYVRASNPERFPIMNNFPISIEATFAYAIAVDAYSNKGEIQDLEYWQVDNSTSVTLISKGYFSSLEITQAVRDGEFVDFCYTIYKSDCCEEHMEPVDWNDGLKDWRRADQVINSWISKYL